MSRAKPRPARRSGCPLNASIEMLGDRWSLLIIRDMIFEGKSAYGEFAQSDEKIASNILADRLSTLEAQGLVSKKVSPANKSKFIYTPTEKTVSLLPFIAELILWGGKYIPGTYTKPGQLLTDLKKDKAGVVKAYTATLKKRIKDEEASK